MRHVLYALTLAVAVALAATAPASNVRAQKGAGSPEVVKALAPTGKLRAAINLGNAVLAQKSANGELGGVTVELARELGKRLGVPVELVEFRAAGRAVAAMQAGEVQLAFIAIEPKRAAQIEFSPPYVVIEGTYMVAKDSPLKAIADVDRAGIRIGTGLASAYDLYLTRTLKNATLVRAKVGGGQASIDIFHEQKLDAAAGVRQALEAHARKTPGVRVLGGHFMEIRQAMGTPKGRATAARYVHGFIEEMKASGFVAAALKRSGQGDATVAPPAAN
ncbi:MAG: ABC transporter substrate-binding protein [Xanthobacteraceae bacterium]